MKRQDHELEEELAKLPDPSLSDPHSTRVRKSRKAVTKAAQAKKILRKNLSVNQKMMFDEEGEPMLEASKVPQSDLGKRYQLESRATGGIDLNEARRYIEAEDRFDKELFHRRVREKHRSGAHPPPFHLECSIPCVWFCEMMNFILYTSSELLLSTPPLKKDMKNEIWDAS